MDKRRVTDINVAVHILNRMLELGTSELCPHQLIPNEDWARCVHTPDPCTTLAEAELLPFFYRLSLVQIFHVNEPKRSAPPTKFADVGPQPLHRPDRRDVGQASLLCENLDDGLRARCEVAFCKFLDTGSVQGRMAVALINQRLKLFFSGDDPRMPGFDRAPAE
jgi:hypothetical protein